MLKLTANLAQSIVDSNMEILKMNINIMDDSGIIIASGDPDRINGFHQGAAEVLRVGLAMEITEEQDKELEGSKMGINLPVKFDGEIVGVVGITGEPEKVRKYGKLVKNNVELMLWQSFIEQQIQLESRANERFVQELLKAKDSNNRDWLIAKSKIFGYDTSVIRVALVAEIVEYKKQKVQDWIHENYDRELEFERAKENALKIIKQNLDPNDMLTPGNNGFIILKAIPHIIFKSNEIKEAVNKVASSIQLQMQRLFKLKISVGIGSIAKDIMDIQDTYQSANLALKIGQKIDEEKGIYDCETIGLGLLIDKISPEAAKYFRKKVNIDAINKDGMVSTLKTFFECNQNANETAKRLYMHRNTLNYRLNKIKDELGLDPRIFYDAVEIYLAILLYEYYK